MAKPFTDSKKEVSLSESRRKEAEEEKQFKLIPQQCQDKIAQTARTGGIIDKLAKVEPNINSTVIDYCDLYNCKPFTERVKDFLDKTEPYVGPDFSQMKSVQIESQTDEEPPFHKSDGYKRDLEEKKAAIKARKEQEESWWPKYVHELTAESLEAAETEFRKKLTAFKAATRTEEL